MEPSWLMDRRRRAAAVIAVAIIGIAAAGLVYLDSSTPSVANPQSGTSASSAPNPRTTLDYVAYAFGSPSVGWALDFSAGKPTAQSNLFWIFRTTDRGTHWQEQLTGQAIFGGFGSLPIQVIDLNHVFMLVRGVREQLYRTIDGGAHWMTLEMPAPHIEELEFSDAEHAWLLTQASQETAGLRELYATDDAGTTWQRMPDPPVNSYLLRYRNASEAWMSGYDSEEPYVFTSNDAGKTWQRHDLPPPPNGSWQLGSFLPPTVELLPGDGVVASVPSASGSVTYPFVSFDQGQTWRYVNPPPGNVAFQDAREWWAITSDRLYKSKSNGETWSLISDKLPMWGLQPQILDSNHAWSAVNLSAEHGLAFTDDSGLHWTRTLVPQPV